MSDYYQYSDTLTPGSVAKAEEVAGEFEGLEAAFDMLPQPRPSGDGFLENIIIPDATLDTHAATWGQLKVLEASSQNAAASANNANNNIQTVLLPDITDKYDTIVALYPDIESWRNETETFNEEARRWASEDEDVVVENGEYSAKHWALKAAQYTSGARSYIGGWSASSGTLPIPSPQIGDAGKFWRITAAGTLPTVGAVVVEDELSIQDNLTYEVLPTNSSVQSVNGKTGSVVVNKGDVGLGNVPNYSATDSLDDGSSSKFSTAKAAQDLKALAEGAQSTANQAVNNASTAQTTANQAQTTASNAVSAAGNAQSTADTANSKADNVTSAHSATATALTALTATVGAQGTAIVEAQADATQGISDAANAQSTADDAGTVANNALSAAQSAQSSASSAQSTANTAVSNASAAQSTANQALSDAQTAQNTADAAQTQVAADAQAQALTDLNTQLRTEFEALLAAYNERWNEIGAFDFNTDVDLNGNDLEGVRALNLPGTSGLGRIVRTGTSLDIENTSSIRFLLNSNSALVINNDRTVSFPAGLAWTSVPANHTRIGNKYIRPFNIGLLEQFDETDTSWVQVNATSEWGVPADAAEVIFDYVLDVTAGGNQNIALLCNRGSLTGTPTLACDNYVNNEFSGASGSMTVQIAIPLQNLSSSARFSYALLPTTGATLTGRLYYRGFTVNY